MGNSLQDAQREWERFKVADMALVGARCPQAIERLNVDRELLGALGSLVDAEKRFRCEKAAGEWRTWDVVRLRGDALVLDYVAAARPARSEEIALVALGGANAVDASLAEMSSWR